jgi:hypothetical protein
MRDVSEAVPGTVAGSFFDLLALWRPAKSIGTDDLVAAVLPLFEQVRGQHEQGHVAPLDGVDALRLHEERELWFDAANARLPRSETEALARIDQPRYDGIDVTGELDVREAEDRKEVCNRRIAQRGQMPDRPLYYLDYTSWEIVAGHHDALTDIFALGMILGSLALRLDFTKRGDLERFLACRRNVHAVNPRIHPVVSRLIAHMTELRRADRAQDLNALVETLGDYRRSETDDFDDRLADLGTIADTGERRRKTQEYLRNRLFEISRRNRLLYFRETMGSANLTVGSLPFTLDHRAIKAEQLLVASERFCRTLERHFEAEDAGRWLSLQGYLRFEDYPFLAPSIDKIRLQAQSDIKEYGFSQLRLALAFLRWHDPAREKAERIDSPLILLPVELRKHRGTDTGFEISPLSSPREADINPVLRHHLREAYGIDLPETIDVTSAGSLKTLHKTIERAIRRRHAGVALHLVAKPRIQLIHRTVKRQLDEYNRRTRKTGRGLKDYGGLAYSYDRDTFEPLGLALFNQHVRVRPAPGREMISQGRPVDASGGAEPVPDAEASRDFYAFDSGQDVDPLNWELDLTAVTLSNFNYRKMSLVRDYGELTNGSTAGHANFDRLFSPDVKPDLPERQQAAYLQRYTVLPVDPSQETAVLCARSGESYVIQGPPGTGKSQTIANLLADYAARGKRVLFICEKRVALDVVFHRLKEAGLKDLTCLVHDTKGDKKAFIAELKRIYEAWREQKGDAGLSARRAKLVADIEGMIAELEAFSQAMMAPAAGSDWPLRRVIDMAVARGATAANLDAVAREKLPSLASLAKAQAHVRDLERIAQAQMAERTPAHALLRFINAEIGRRDRPVGFLSTVVPAARAALDAIDALSRIPLPGAGELTLDDLAEQSRRAIALHGLARSDKLHLLDRRHPERARFEEACRRLLDQQAELDRAEQAATHWVTRPSADETEVALSIARRREGRWLSFLHGDWRRLKRRMRQCHRGEVLSFVHLLERLAAEHAARTALVKERKATAVTYGCDDLAAITDLLAHAADERRRFPAEAALIAHCLAEPADAARTVLAMAAEGRTLETAREQLDQLLQGYGGATTAALRSYLADVETHLEAVGELLPHLARLAEGAPEVAAAWHNLGLGFDELETATLLEGISRTYSAAPDVARFDGARLKGLAERLEGALAELRTLNARSAVATCRTRFRENLAAVQAVGRSAADATNEITAYREGCRLLEHQFGLTRPSKTLRELLTGESGAVLRDLKPIWMMSPLSVADVLPFADDLFDAVIFDEASQVPVEDAVPSLYRARQTIIVGDEMQLPPTSFFAANRDGDDTLPDYIAYAVSADSLLTKAVTTLASTRLTWHYRSRHEALISFCNRAFYNGELNTVPGRTRLKAAPEIVNAVPIQQRAQAQLADPLLDRPVSFHQVEKGIYRDQQNHREAEYVAELLRSLLKRRTNKSIGIVAFSQPQALAIEEAIAALAATDRAFANRIEDERDREVDGQVAGLFVKNLESVQGDERDIIIVSVGYAPGPDGKMRMNFGPINQSGGEKRLNVIFSRAKHHIAIVASIAHDHITNDFNAGANTLKQYLRYAAAVSAGHEEAMHRCLDALGERRGAMDGRTTQDAVATRIAAQLASEGMVATPGVGHSTLRIDVAGRKPDEDGYVRAYLVDTEDQYASTDVVERHVTRPAIFRAFGWEVEQVLGKDWVLRERQ